ncbi:DUF2703 domain-containing protein [Halalkalibacter urbisdiaboli]|uniref:DUF2703 domain-containing protein n=1 Tax=Halalkalibacter urbisdiaboli TaxID=1960589 RepID=UPI000B4472B3|nr:DUF2703 domain-containing protein [Halalkalibacter urbisdiaboli]
MSNCQNDKARSSDTCDCNNDESKRIIVEQEKKQLIIDFMYIDLQVCTRCQGTEKSLKDAVNEVSNLLENIGYDVEVNNILVEDEEQAKSLKFISSPTIRINGEDIQLTIKESNCDTCGTLTGSSVDCRVWIYEGKEYNEVPKSLIMDAILKEVYRTEQNLLGGKKESYVLPENLKRFFARKRIHIEQCCIPNEGTNECC